MNSQLPTRSGYPNFSNITSVPDNSTWTCPDDGIILLTGLDFSGGNLFITINGQQYTSTYKKSGNGGGAATPWTVRKGDRVLISWNAQYSQHSCYFIYFY